MSEMKKSDELALAAMDSQCGLAEVENTFGEELANIRQMVMSSQYMKIPTGELASLGSAFSAFPSCFRTMQQTISTASNTEGLFRCTFPGGVSGTLMAASKGISSQEEKRLKKTMDTFIRYKDSGVPTFANNIDSVKRLHNEPVELLWGPDKIYLRNTAETNFAG